MSGELNLYKTLEAMEISCDNEKYSFATTSVVSHVDIAEIVGLFKEKEGYTLIAKVGYLNQLTLKYDSEFAMLSINVHTSLDMVGLTAVLAKKLADVGISANVIAGYYHDHVFVQYEQRDEAIDVLKR